MTPTSLKALLSSRSTRPLRPGQFRDTLSGRGESRTVAYSHQMQLAAEATTERSVVIAAEDRRVTATGRSDVGGCREGRDLVRVLSLWAGRRLSRTPEEESMTPSSSTRVPNPAADPPSVCTWDNADHESAKHEPTSRTQIC